LGLSYRFGRVEVRPAERLLLVEGRPASVGARAFDVLLALIDRRDRVVTKDELFDLVWPGLVVEENNLHVQVSTLRKLLGPQSVATIPGRGFRFALPLEQGDALAHPLPASAKHNLPAQLNSFVGRDREIGEIKTLLGSARLVTLTSPGGSGKTRLSLQAAAGVLADYPDGAWLVELAPVADERLVPQTVASVLGVKEEAGRPVIEALMKYVKDRRLLILMDNCEHLVPACRELIKHLLQAGPGVTVLASSREQMHMAGEAIYPVAALAVPEAHPAITAEALARYEAVRLFVDRAVAVQPTFEVTAANAAAVADICRRLEGIPLAIELAAARVRTLSVERIALLLSDCFRLLRGGDQTALPRQQTLRASIDWSYELLTVPERILLRRLAVFAGGWTLEAAEAVGSGGDVEEAAVLDLLIHLVEKSLVDSDASGERYRLLETVRQYAQELLKAAGEEDATRTRHLEHYLTLAEKARPELLGPRQGVWLSRLDQERENLLSAHAWCDGAKGGAELGLRLASAVRHYWLSRGLLGLGYRITVEALSRAHAGERNHARCRALADAGQLGYFMGRYAEAQRYLEESLAIAREMNDTRRIAAALQPLGMACLGQGDLATARRHLEEALALARKLDNQRDLAAAINQLAQFHRVQGDLDAAEPLYEQVLAIARQLRDRESIAFGLLNFAMASIERGLFDRARLMLVEAHAIAEEIGSKRAGQSVLEVCAGLASLDVEWERAAELYGTAETQAGQTGLQRDPADEAFLAPLIAKARKALGEAAFDAAEAAGRALSYEEGMRRARAWLELAAS
jgi:predicted ATPase/DNA-binding winged helix-turn-helix (wHTH) protein